MAKGLPGRPRSSKTSKATPAPVKPVKQALTKSSALVSLIAEGKRDSAEDGGPASMRHWKTCSSVRSIRVALAEFVLPGLPEASVCARFRHARPAHSSPQSRDWPNGSEAAAKPASVRVKIRALSKLKAAASP